MVTPILNEGKLFGLLVAHQCSQPRNWQDYEIRWMTQIATQVGFGLDNASLLRKVKDEAVSNELFNSFTNSIRDCLNEPELLKIAVEKARKGMGLDRAIVYQFDANWNGTVVAESLVPGYPRALRSQITDPCFARDYAEKYRQGRVSAISNIAQANLTECYREQLTSFVVKASLVAPILQNNQLFGLFIGHQCAQPRSWKKWEIDLFVRLALQLGWTLERVKLREELSQAQNLQIDQANQQQQASPNIQQDISEPVTENPTALQNLKAKISNQSAAKSNFTNEVGVNNLEHQEQPNDQETIGQIEKNQLENDSNPKGITETTEKVQELNQSRQNLAQMISLINDIKEKMDRSEARQITPDPLLMEETTGEVNDVTLNQINNPDPKVNETTKPSDGN